MHILKCTHLDGKTLFLISCCLISCTPITLINKPEVYDKKKYNTEDAFIMHIESQSFHILHSNEFIIKYDNSQTGIQRIYNFIYEPYQSLPTHIEKQLSYIGYKKYNKDAKTLDSPIPIYIWYKNMKLLNHNINRPYLLLITLIASKPIKNVSNKDEMPTFRTALIKNKKFELDFSSFYNLPIWKVILTVEGNSFMNDEATLIKMIKCATPYLSINFSGSVTCSRL